MSCSGGKVAACLSLVGLGFGKSIFLKCYTHVNADLSRFHSCMAEPQSDNGTINASTRRTPETNLDFSKGDWK
jgi:hypothetical protein